jgi:hypothetical protein
VELGRIDVATSTRMATFTYTTPPTAAETADAVLDEALADHATVGSAGAALTSIIVTNAAIKARTDLITSGRLSVLPGPAIGRVTVYRGDDYLEAEDRRLAWPLPEARDLSQAVVTLGIYARGEPTPLVIAAGVVLGGGTPNQTVHVALTAAQTGLLPAGFDTCYSLLRANYGTPELPECVTLQEDRWTVLPAAEARE